MQLYRVLQGYPSELLMVLGTPPEPNAELLPCRYESLRLITRRLALTRFQGWTTALNSLNTFAEIQLGASIRTVAGFRPDLVVTVMDNLSYYKHAWALAKRLDVNFATITMDDPQAFEQVHPSFSGVFDRLLHRIYGDASLSLGVSHEMCAYLEHKFGRPSIAFYFGPPDGMKPREPEASAALKSPPGVILGYAGTMMLGYAEGIRAIIPALEATSTRLVVYTRDRLNVEHPLVIGRGYLPPEDLWPTIKAECDAVILPYSFEESIGRIYRTHFPTKLSEYCWTGMPMIFSGPAYATGIRWAKQRPAAVLTSTQPTVELPSLLRRLAGERNLRVSLAKEGARVASNEFDPEQIRSRFSELLRLAAQRRSKSAAAE
jgi:hypothetical protein